MDSRLFVQELQKQTQPLFAKLAPREASALDVQTSPDVIQLLRIALANEISVSELAAAWMPLTPEWDVKIALAQQAGDEAKHFKLIESRLIQLGIDLETFKMPAGNPLFDYLRGLASTVERIAAGQLTLEAIAYDVNERFMKYAEAAGDEKTLQLYRNLIQPEELFHQQLGKQLLEKYAITPEAQRQAREAAIKTLEMAAESRSLVAAKIGTACFPGC